MLHASYEILQLLYYIFFCSGQSLNHRSCIFYALFQPTKLSSRYNYTNLYLAREIQRKESYNDNIHKFQLNL